jgi:small subunit ribosomal protein S16
MFNKFRFKKEVKGLAVKIRLKRMGAKKAPFYRLVVADSRMPRDGRFIEEIGYYNPVSQPAQLNINSEKAIEWLKKGAQPSDTVKNLFRKNGIYKELQELKNREEDI